MDVEQIRDERSLKAWLEARPESTRHADAVAIAQRAALRVFPLWSRSMGKYWAQKANLTALPILRALFACAAFLKSPQLETMLAAESSTREAAVISPSPVIPATAPAAHVANASFAAAFAAGTGTANAGIAAVSSAILAVLHSDASPAGFGETLFLAIRSDARQITAGVDPTGLSLWPDATPEWFTRADQKGRAIWADDPDTWAFWTRWWDGVLSGNQIDWSLQKAIALELTEDDWKTPQTAAARIREIEAEFTQQHRSVDHELAKLTPAKPEHLKAVRAAMERNQASLPPTFDAIEGLLLLEIERLQRSNDQDEDWRRQMGVYLALYEAVQGLRESLPISGAVSALQAEKSERLLRVYLNKFKELPRAKADEIVNGTWTVGKGMVKAGLIYSTSLLAVSYGLPALAAVAIGSLVFAPKESTEIIKAAKEALPKG